MLGHQIPAGGGEQDGLQVIDILARHPSTARFISTKLARRFVADDPPPALIDHMARTFTKTDGDLRAVLETMFTSREFFSEGACQAKIKSPLEMVVSAARALDAHATDTFTLVQKIADMGEPLYGKEAPNGYKDTARGLAQYRRPDGAHRVRRCAGEWADSRRARSTAPDSPGRMPPPSLANCCTATRPRRHWRRSNRACRDGSRLPD